MVCIFLVEYLEDYADLRQLKHFGKLPIIGGKSCDGVTKIPAHGESFKIGDRISVKALHTPCHTQDSICYFMEDGDQRAVFSGDTLFIGGEFSDMLASPAVHLFSRMRPFLRRKCPRNAQSAE